jgi:hypothetical protein
MSSEKNALLVKPSFNARHDVRQMLLRDLVICLPPLFFVRQQTAPLHQPEMLGSHVAGNSASLGEFTDRVSSSEQHLHHPQPMRMGKSLEAFSRLPQSVQWSQLGRFDRFRGRNHPTSFLYSNISGHYDTSIALFLGECPQNGADE